MLERAAKEARQRSNQDSGGDVKLYPQPSMLAPGCVLRTYQVEGLSWLINNYDRSINCILADEMGLGKMMTHSMTEVVTSRTAL
jgi:SNF2 family DNA or RNA helicase